MHELAIGAATQHNRIAILKRAQFLVEFSNLCRTHKCEIERPEKDNTPFSANVIGCNGLELLALLNRHTCRKRKIRKLFTDSQQTTHLDLLLDDVVLAV